MCFFGDSRVRSDLWALSGICLCTKRGSKSALDQATEKKITADSLADLNEVVRLCDQAIKKGLDEPNTEYANNLLTGTLVQRAEILTTAIMGQTPPDPRWPELRSRGQGLGTGH